jgi:hypothetical protein
MQWLDSMLFTMDINKPGLLSEKCALVQYVMHFPKLEPYVSLLVEPPDPEGQARVWQERARLRAIVQARLACNAGQSAVSTPEGVAQASLAGKTCKNAFCVSQSMAQPRLACSSGPIAVCASEAILPARTSQQGQTLRAAVGNFSADHSLKGSGHCTGHEAVSIGCMETAASDKQVEDWGLHGKPMRQPNASNGIEQEFEFEEGPGHTHGVGKGVLQGRQRENCAAEEPRSDCSLCSDRGLRATARRQCELSALEPITAEATHDSNSQNGNGVAAKLKYLEDDEVFVGAVAPDKGSASGDGDSSDSFFADGLSSQSSEVPPEVDDVASGCRAEATTLTQDAGGAAGGSGASRVAQKRERHPLSGDTKGRDIVAQLTQKRRVSNACNHIRGPQQQPAGMEVHVHTSRTAHPHGATPHAATSELARSSSVSGGTKRPFVKSGMLHMGGQKLRAEKGQLGLLKCSSKSKKARTGWLNCGGRNAGEHMSEASQSNPPKPADAHVGTDSGTPNLGVSGSYSGRGQRLRGPLQCHHLQGSRGARAANSVPVRVRQPQKAAQLQGVTKQPLRTRAEGGRKRRRSQKNSHE